VTKVRTLLSPPTSLDYQSGNVLARVPPPDQLQRLLARRGRLRFGVRLETHLRQDRPNIQADFRGADVHLINPSVFHANCSHS